MNENESARQTQSQAMSFKTMDGSERNISDYNGQVVLVVNVASKCGLTPQYEGLEKVYRKFHDRGLEILGFPCNDFLAQEPGSNEEIMSFCQTQYNVSFPLMAKVKVRGKDKHPLYAELIRAQPSAQKEPGSSLEAKLQEIGQKKEAASDILWNFEKFLIDRKGQVVARFNPDVAPDSDLIRSKIEALL